MGYQRQGRHPYFPVLAKWWVGLLQEMVGVHCSLQVVRALGVEMAHEVYSAKLPVVFAPVGNSDIDMVRYYSEMDNYQKMEVVGS